MAGPEMWCRGAPEGQSPQVPGRARILSHCPSTAGSLPPTSPCQAWGKLARISLCRPHAHSIFAERNSNPLPVLGLDLGVGYPW